MKIDAMFIWYMHRPWRQKQQASSKHE